MMSLREALKLDRRYLEFPIFTSVDKERIRKAKAQQVCAMIQCHRLLNNLPFAIWWGHLNR